MKNDGIGKSDSDNWASGANNRAPTHGRGNGFSCATTPRRSSRKCDVNASPSPSMSSTYVFGPNAYDPTPTPKSAVVNAGKPARAGAFTRCWLKYTPGPVFQLRFG